MSTSSIIKYENKNTIKIYEFFIFNRSGVCLIHLDLQEDSINLTNKALNVTNKKNNDNRYKLIFGLLFSMKSFVKSISPNKTADYFKSFATSNFKLHYIEILNGLRLVFLSGPTNLDLGTYLKDIYSAFYVNYISKNILINKDEPIKNEIFIELVANYINNLNNSLN